MELGRRRLRVYAWPDDTMARAPRDVQMRIADLEMHWDDALHTVAGWTPAPRGLWRPARDRAVLSIQRVQLAAADWPDHRAYVEFIDASSAGAALSVGDWLTVGRALLDAICVRVPVHRAQLVQDVFF